MDYLSNIGDQVASVIDHSSNPNSTFAQTINEITSGNFQLDFAGGAQVENLIAGVLIAVGVLMVFYGCRLFKATLFAFIFIATSALTFYIAMRENVDSKFAFALSILTGIFVALVSLKVFKLTLFAIGAAVGFVIWVAAKSLYPQYFTSEVITYAALLIPMVVLGVISLYMEQYYLLVATPIVGSFMLAQGVDHFAHLEINVFGTLSGDEMCHSDACYATWAGVIGLALLGMVVQYNYTSKFANSKPRTKTVYKEKYVQMPEPVKGKSASV